MQTYIVFTAFLVKTFRRILIVPCVDHVETRPVTQMKHSTENVILLKTLLNAQGYVKEDIFPSLAILMIVNRVRCAKAQKLGEIRSAFMTRCQVKSNVKFQ